MVWDLPVGAGWAGWRGVNVKTTPIVNLHLERSRLTVDRVGTVLGHEYTLDFTECPLAIDAAWNVWEAAEDVDVFDATNRDMSLV